MLNVEMIRYQVLLGEYFSEVVSLVGRMQIGSCSTIVEDNGIKYIQFENLKKYEQKITHCFSTRIGGVSTGECSTLNLGFNRKDTRENVLENYHRLCRVIGVDPKNLVLSNQVHDNRVRIVNEDDRGKGIFIESDIKGYDGLVTNKPGVALVTFYADCVPLYFYDPEKNVIALSHSGWRGTVKRIAVETVRVMADSFGCAPQKLEVVIGPSIGKCCFEVGVEVVEAFEREQLLEEGFVSPSVSGRWHLDLQGIIKRMLEASGVRAEAICTSGICTKCNGDLLYSHRGHGGKTGSLAAIMQLR